MRILDLDTITISRQPGNHRRLLALQTKGGELLAVEMTDEEASGLAEKLTAPLDGEQAPK